MTDLKRRIKNLAVSIDQTLFCTITLGDSNPDETPSSYAWRAERAGKWQGKLFRPLIDFIFRLFGQHNHCESAWLSEHKSETWRGIDQ